MGTPPARIGRYDVVELVGRGPQGAVYRARDPILEREVAVKLFEADAASQADWHRLRHDLRATARLQHRNILTVFDVGEEQGRIYVASEYLAGETVASLIARRATMPVASKLKLVEDVCDGLEHAHQHGVVHADLWAARVMVLSDGTPKILGLGLASIAERPSPENRAYTAPERLAGKAVDARADIFSAGAILRDLLGLDGSNDDALIQSILERSLNPDPGRRYERAFEMAEELARARLLRLQQQSRVEAAEATRVLLEQGSALPPPPSMPSPAPSAPAPVSRVPASPAPARPAEPMAPPSSRGSSLTGRIGGALRAMTEWLRPAERSAETATEPEPVLFGASAPRSVATGATFTARFAAYAEAREETVAARLRALGADSARTVVGLRPARGGRWKVGTPVTVRISGGPFSAEPAEQSFEWNGAEHILAFIVHTNAEARDGDAPLQFEVFIEGISIAAVVIDVRVGGAAAVTTATTATSRAPSTAFASYASQDAALVALCLSALQRWDPGLKVFMDCLDLTPNEQWQAELARVIPEKDAFLLFWSANAMRSRWVRWEIETRRSARGIESIRPMPLEDPQIAPPPAELGHLHFRDRFLIARQGFLRVDDPRP